MYGRKSLRAALVFASATGMLALASANVGAVPVTGVRAIVEGRDGPLPAVMERRIEAGVGTVGEQILIGRDTEEVRAHSDEYARVTTDILDRILYGYTVERLSVMADETTDIYVRLVPYGPVVESVRTEIHYGNLAQAVIPYVHADIGSIAGQAEQILIGVPTDSLDWSAGIVERTMRERLEDRLPEFTVRTELEGEANPVLHVYLVPTGDIVRRTETNIVSDTLPTAVFWSLKKKFDNYVKVFEGVPAAFVSRHESEILADVQTELNETRAHARFGVALTPALLTGANLELRIDAETDSYTVKADGYIDMGRTDSEVALRLHMGYRRGKHEYFIETELYPETYTWRFYPSYAYRMTPSTTIAYQFNLNESEHRTRIVQDFGDKWHLRLQRDWKGRRNEFGLGYDIHDYVTLEYIFDDDDNWLRVIGHM